MHRYLRLSAFLCAAVIADRNQDGSLLRENKTAQTSNRNSKPLASLLESAKAFLTNGATPDVVEFANATLVEIEDNVIPKIEEEAEADRVWLDQTWARFDKTIAELVENHEAIDWRAKVAGNNVKYHRECRTNDAPDEPDEEMACTEKRECETTLSILWKEWQGAEFVLRSEERDFEEHFCPTSKNGTLDTFRSDASTLMGTWSEKKVNADDKAGAYDAQLTDCDKKNKALDERSNDCNVLMATMQESECAHRHKIMTTLQQFHSSWSSDIRYYQGLTDLIYNQTQDRKKEYKTLRVVRCLLQRVHELNGRPCDEENGGVSDVVAHCEQLANDIEVCTEKPKLCLLYQQPPPVPPQCDDPAPADGKCLPDPDKFRSCETEMTSLTWAPPTGKFTESNPGCNDYPKCDELRYCVSAHEGVPTLDYPTWKEPPASFAISHQATFGSNPYFHEGRARNSVWGSDGTGSGATVDGCSGDNHNTHDWEGDQTGEKIPFTVQPAEEVAAVRCCSEDGVACTSQIGGICWNSASLRAAVAICHNDGKRLCTQQEMDQCCGTGCWFNHYPVWINPDVDV